MARSGIGVSPDLQDKLSSAVAPPGHDQPVRFIKISIQNESLVHDSSFELSGSFEQDLPLLQSLVGDDTPAYVLVRLDQPSTDWLAVTYIPETAKVRDKMLYSSSRTSFMRSFSSNIADSLFANSKADLTPSAYAKHRAHIAAPKPLSAREVEMEGVLAAQREAEKAYPSSRARINNTGREIGFPWDTDVEDAVKALADPGDASTLVVVKIEPKTEKLILGSVSGVPVKELGSRLPPSEPSYAFYSWCHSFPNREIVFIYSCPTSSPIMSKMLYSSGCSHVFRMAQTLLSSIPNSRLASRKIETSDPKEIDENYLLEHIGPSSPDGKDVNTVEKETRFARPKRPGRRK